MSLPRDRAKSAAAVALPWAAARWQAEGLFGWRGAALVGQQEAVERAAEPHARRVEWLEGGELVKPRRSARRNQEAGAAARWRSVARGGRASKGREWGQEEQGGRWKPKPMARAAGGRESAATAVEQSSDEAGGGRRWVGAIL